MIAEDTRQVEEAHPDFFGVQLVYVWPQGLDVMQYTAVYNGYDA